MRISDWSSDVCSSDLSSARHAVTRLLAGQPIDLSEAETAARGLELLAEQPFDCIILDLSLPDASGFEFLERLAQRGPLPPVVIYSARDLTRDEDLRLREYTDSIDRKSVVSGKSVSVRVDLGGRRSIKKKKKTNKKQRKMT